MIADFKCCIVNDQHLNDWHDQQFHDRGDDGIQYYPKGDDGI